MMMKNSIFAVFMVAAASMISTVSAQDAPAEQVVWSQEYMLQTKTNRNSGEWLETTLDFCVMQEVAEGTAAVFPAQLAKNDKLWLTNDSVTRLVPVEGTVQSEACYDRKSIGKKNKQCGSYHVDQNKSGSLRVHYCE
ncbi:expressed unknown protein [Seminavis robusta]|uniref:Uncharacterized protein n=1 Tax=Seminavis robusta TaxID=568900 RepID=A0A9N8D7K4_9STRA|nr:expressed unknown protein [Seminavis robusta]|eukprot:Sro7_g006250.1 n/a (137) ;mRNA; f:206460-206870